MLRKTLEDKRARLREIVQQGMRVGERAGYSNHMADDATEVFEQTTNLALLESLRDSLRRVEDALQRFEKGSYGICADCGRVIEWERLKALPYTKFCVGCVQRHEGK